METKKNEPGVVISWEEKMKEYVEIKGDAELVKKWWENIDTLACVYLWFVVTGL